MSIEEGGGEEGGGDGGSGGGGGEKYEENVATCLEGCQKEGIVGRLDGGERLVTEGRG